MSVSSICSQKTLFFSSAGGKNGKKWHLVCANFFFQFAIKKCLAVVLFSITRYKVASQKHGVIRCGLDVIRLVWRGIKTGVIPLLLIFSLQSSIDCEAPYEPNICCASLPKGTFYIWNITHIFISQIPFIAAEALIRCIFRQAEWDLYFSSLCLVWWLLWFKEKKEFYRTLYQMLYCKSAVGCPGLRTETNIFLILSYLKADNLSGYCVQRSTM